MNAVKLIRSIFKLLCRLYPLERGKQKLLQEVYLPRLAPTVPLITRTSLSNGITMDLDISEFVQSHLYLFGSYELPTVRFIRSHVRPGMTLIDVGAQIGYITLEMSRAGGSGVSLYSFEPEPRNIAKLNANLRLNDINNVTIVDRAVSDHDGLIRLFMSSDNNAGTHSTIASGPFVSNDFIEIPCVRLDTFVREQAVQSVDMIKIDVEGGELEVLKGAEETLRRFKPVLIVEMSSSIQQSRGFSVPKFKEMLRDWGYSAYSINTDGSLSLTNNTQDHEMENLVFLPVRQHVA